VHAGVGQRLGLARMQQQIEQLPADSFWHSLAKIALSDDLTDLQRSIAQQAMSHQEGSAGEILDRWEQGNRQALERAQRLLQELRDTGSGDLAMLSVALRELRNLV
jgi:glutamate dehydrogenase